MRILEKTTAAMFLVRCVLVFAATSVAVGSGCAFSEGKPWGEAKFEVRPGFDAKGRIEKGTSRVMTASDYRIEVESVKLQLDTISLVMASVEGKAKGFDPAKPPEGYSLCHNGHCHANDGKLVPYDKVAAQMGVSAGGLEVTGVADARVVITPKMPIEAMTWASPVTSFKCADPHCDMPHGSPTAVKLRISGLVIKGRAFDATKKNRVPATGQEFTLTYDGGAGLDVSSAIPGKLPESGDATTVDAALKISPRIFDDIETFQENLSVGEKAIDAGISLTVKTKDDE